MEIYVALPNGKIISLEEETSNTIKNVKEKIQTKEGIPFDQQSLMFNTGQKSEELTDDCILSDCNNSIQLRLVLKLKYFKIYVRGSHGRGSHGCEEILQVKGLDTIGYIKQNVFKYAPQANKKMFLDNNELEDEHIVNDYNIQNESTLTLHLTDDRDVQLYVKTLTGKSFILHVHMWDTIANVKEKIQDREGIPPDQQNLHDTTLWKDDRTSSDYGCRYYDEDVVGLVLRLPGSVPGVDNRHIIFIKLVTGKTIDLYVQSSEKIKDLKYYIQSKELISCDQQRWLLNGKQLINEKRLYDYFYILENPTINLSVAILYI